MLFLSSLTMLAAAAAAFPTGVATAIKRDPGAVFIVNDVDGNPSGYYLQAANESAAHGELSPGEESTIEVDFTRASQAQGDAAGFSSDSLGDQGEHIVMTVALMDGRRVRDTQGDDWDDIGRSMLEFRDDEGFPFEFGVNLLTGDPNGDHGQIGAIAFNVE